MLLTIAQNAGQPPRQRHPPYGMVVLRRGRTLACGKSWPLRPLSLPLSLLFRVVLPTFWLMAQLRTESPDAMSTMGLLSRLMAPGPNAYMTPVSAWASWEPCFQLRSNNTLK